MKSLKKQKIHLDIKKAKNKKGCSIAVALFARNQELSFLVPEEEGKGVRRIAVKVAKDVEKTMGMHAASGEMPDIHLMKKRF